MLERPYRIVPSNIVLKQDQPYQLIIQAGNEWHQFRADLLGLDIVLPPGCEAIIDLRPQRLGVFRLKDERKIPESHLLSTITVIPANMSIDSWNNSWVKPSGTFPTTWRNAEYAVCNRGFDRAGRPGSIWRPPSCNAD